MRPRPSFSPPVLILYNRQQYPYAGMLYRVDIAVAVDSAMLRPSGMGIPVGTWGALFGLTARAVTCNKTLLLCINTRKFPRCYRYCTGRCTARAQCLGFRKFSKYDAGTVAPGTERRYRRYRVVRGDL
jgi:hypothetical protein